MLNSGDVVQLDLGVPRGSGVGLMRPAIVTTAQRVLARGPRVIQVVPLTRSLRGYALEVTVVADPETAWTSTPQRSVSTSGPWPLSG